MQKKVVDKEESKNKKLSALPDGLYKIGALLIRQAPCNGGYHLSPLEKVILQIST
ncbi:MAG: hypothetical protein IJO52_10560 [Clostridia bacterium]|nr:hypothetical protein [Clostridia bacterium]